MRSVMGATDDRDPSENFMTHIAAVALWSSNSNFIYKFFSMFSQTQSVVDAADYGEHIYDSVYWTSGAMQKRPGRHSNLGSSKNNSHRRLSVVDAFNRMTSCCFAECY
jgi:hypothetical protein